MLYRPNFCCNCGEKIERVEWNLLTSRRFCVVCSAENRAHDILPRLTVTAGALALMFGFGSLWSGSGQAEPAVRQSPVGIKSSSPTTVQAGTPVNEVQAEIPSNPTVRTAEAVKGQTTVVDKNAAKYFCGALTKKGTPCSRKVKAKGQRCFQHEGKPEAPTPE
jgi:hypothetical protein